MAEEKGIKETLELIAAVKVLVVEGKKIMADGKVSVSDIGALFGLLQKFSVLNAGIKDAKEIVAEAKDLSSEEAEQVIAAVLDLANAAKA